MRVRSWIVFLSFLIFPFIGNGQIIYNFENGDLSDWEQSDSGHWAISAISPISGGYSLHHVYDSPISGHDQISLPVNIDYTRNNVVWRFKVRHGYTPSSSNNWAVILMSDRPAVYMNSDSIFCGYAIGVDLYKFRDDTLSLYRIDSGNVEVILKTNINWEEEIGTSAAGIVVIRSVSGEWTLFLSKTLNYDSLEFIGRVEDNRYTDGEYFGIYYEYTYSQDRKFWFDDLQILYNKPNGGFVSTRNIADSIGSIVNYFPGQEISNIILKDGAEDSSNTYIKDLILMLADNSQIDDLTKLVEGALLETNSGYVLGNITKQAITFPVEVNILNGDSVNYSFKLWLKSDIIYDDNSEFSFILKSSNIIVWDTNFAFRDTNLLIGPIVYSVEATEISFQDVPLTVKPNVTFGLKVIATDRNGNIDRDANFPVTLSLAFGGGNLYSASGLTHLLENGISIWNDLKYSQLGTFAIYAVAEGFATIRSPEIVANKYLYFLLDDFEDGQINDWHEKYSGHWAATDIDAINGNYSLAEVYDNSESCVDLISHKLVGVSFDTTLIWRFRIRYKNSSPSSSNNWNVILFSDLDPSIVDTISGYGLGINWNSTDDYLSLYRLDTGEVNTIFKTSLNWQEQISPDQVVDIVVSRDTIGVWSVYIDTTDGMFDNLHLLGNVIDTNYNRAEFFGIRYKYTSALDRKLWIDDIYFGQVIPDTLAPHLDTVVVYTPLRLEVFFNEALDTNSLSVSNFRVNGNNPIKISFVNDRQILLTLLDSLREDTLNRLVLQNISDLANNILVTDTFYFSWENFAFKGYVIDDYRTLRVFFNKNLSAQYVRDSISVEVIPQADITDISAEKNSLIIKFADSLELGREYYVQIDTIKDSYGNILTDLAFDFTFYIAQPYDVAINEIMFDVKPAPPGLPQAKYIELYNKTNFDLNLYNWTLKIGSLFSKPFPNIILPAQGYVIICAPEYAQYFEHFSVVAPILEEKYLTTTSKVIKVKNNLGEQIDRISYSVELYHDSDRDDGGYSIERIDPYNICYQLNNWHASINPLGGTPGFRNSVYGNNPDTLPLLVERFLITSSATMDIYYNKPVDDTSGVEQLNYILNHSTTPLYAYIDRDTPNLVHLVFIVTFNSGDNSLLIRNVEDICSHKIKDTVLHFYYEKIRPTAVVPISNRQLKVYFSEAVDKSRAEQIVNYYLLETDEHPIWAVRDNFNPKVVHLLFNDSLLSDVIYHLSLNNITDEHGVRIDSTVLEFAYHSPQLGDIVFNEFMTDVSPEPVGLPKEKYIELKNNSEFNIWLQGWTLQLPGNKIVELPEIEFKANSYILLVDKQASYSGDNIVKVLSENDIKTEGLYVLRFRDQVMDAINLDTSFWGDVEKSSGGWSVERVNSGSLCGGKKNWSVTLSASGGTPLAPNSIENSEAVFSSARVLAFNVISSRDIVLGFDQEIFDKDVWNLDNYLLNGNKPADVRTDNYKDFVLHFAVDMNISGINNFAVELRDNCGNTVVFDTSFVYHKIHLTALVPIDSMTLFIKFSEAPSVNSLLSKENFTLNSAYIPVIVTRDNEDSTIVYLQFDEPFVLGRNELSIDGIQDIYGHEIERIDTGFFYYIPKSGDVVINEILFNPLSGHEKFVELYNNSEYPIYLHFLSLSSYDSDNEKIELGDAMLGHVFLPYSYLVVTPDSLDIQNVYPYHGEYFVQTVLPKLRQDTGSIMVLTYNDTILDCLFYSDEMHNRLLSNTKGVSLERINPNLPTNERSTWTSASYQVSYGTPGLKNSEYIPLDSTFKAEIDVEPSVFSPDNDGVDDLLYIKISGIEPGLACEIKILSKAGFVVRNLVNNKLISSDEFVVWDGFDDSGRLLPRGIYVVLIKLYDDKGKVSVFRKVIALTTKN